MGEGTLTIEVTASHVAWYGAILATISAAVHLGNYFRDRKRGKVSFQRNMSFAPPGLYTSVYTIVTVVNTGRRPFTINTIALTYLNGGGMVFTDVVPALPCELKEGQQARAIVDEVGIDFGKVRSFVAYDATGHRFQVNVASWPRRAYWTVRASLTK